MSAHKGIVYKNSALTNTLTTMLRGYMATVNTAKDYSHLQLTLPATLARLALSARDSQEQPAQKLITQIGITVRDMTPILFANQSPRQSPPQVLAQWPLPTFQASSTTEHIPLALLERVVKIGRKLHVRENENSLLPRMILLAQQEGLSTPSTARCAYASCNQPIQLGCKLCHQDFYCSYEHAGAFWSKNTCNPRNATSPTSPRAPVHVRTHLPTPTIQ